MSSITNTSTNGRFQVAAAATAYHELGIAASLVESIHIQWFDAVSSATITLETTNLPTEDAATSATATAGNWVPETSVTITGPTAAAASGSMTHLGNIGSRRARLKIVAAANCDLRVTPHGKD
jgi:hypothetical protein